MEYCIKSTINTRGILPILSTILFCADRLTKHLVDRVSADDIGYYMQGSGKSDKYGFFSVACLKKFDVVRRVFKFLHKIYHFKLNFAFKAQVLM